MSDLIEEIKQAIETTIPCSEAEVSGQKGHYIIRVVSREFEGKRTLEKQRMVFGAIQPWISGSNAPIHAVDHLETVVP